MLFRVKGHLDRPAERRRAHNDPLARLHDPSRADQYSLCSNVGLVTILIGTKILETGRIFAALPERPGQGSAYGILCRDAALASISRLRVPPRRTLLRRCPL